VVDGIIMPEPSDEAHCRVSATLSSSAVLKQSADEKRANNLYKIPNENLGFILEYFCRAYTQKRKFVSSFDVLFNRGKFC
jgi:hypothetical protein